MTTKQTLVYGTTMHSLNIAKTILHLVTRLHPAFSRIACISAAMIDSLALWTSLHYAHNANAKIANSQPNKAIIFNPIKMRLSILPSSLFSFFRLFWMILSYTLSVNLVVMLASILTVLISTSVIGLSDITSNAP